MKGSILVVEGDPSLDRHLKEVLAARWTVAGVVTAADARARLKEEHFDLLLFDLHLPDRDGLDLLAELEREGLVQRTISPGTATAPAPSAPCACTPSTELEAAVEKAMSEPPVVTAPLEVLLARARRLLRAGKIVEAEAELTAARMHHPDSPEVVNLLGIAAELRHDLTTAVDLYNLAERLRPYPPARRNSERLVFRSPAEKCLALQDEEATAGFRFRPRSAGHLFLDGSPRSAARCSLEKCLAPLRPARDGTEAYRKGSFYRFPGLPLG